jgi:UPF0716 family protein affecting phage T7 exclusion
VDISIIISLVVSVLCSLMCFGAGVLVLLAILGFMMLRRRGKQNVTAKEAVAAGAERVSQVFRRSPGGGLEAVDDDDDGPNN